MAEPRLESYSQFSDEDLLVLLQERDKIAFAELYRRHWDAMYLHAFRLIQDEEIAKDVIQDVFVVFWEKASEIGSIRNPKAYLYTSLRNRMLSLIRRDKVSQHFQKILIDKLEDFDERLVERIDAKDLVRLIDLEIKKFPPRMREVFELSRQSFLSNKEIAEQLGLSEDAVKKHIQRAILLLRSRFGHFVGFGVVVAHLFERPN